MNHLSTWIPVVSTLVSVGLGAVLGFLGSSMQFRREKGWQEAQQRREQVERAFTLLQEVRSEVESSGALAVLQLSQGHKMDLPSSAGPLGELTMVIKVHLRALEPKLTAVLKAHQSMWGMILRLQMDQPSRRESGRPVSELAQGLASFGKAVEGLEEGLLAMLEEGPAGGR